MNNWILGNPRNAKDIVLSSKIKLIRNIEGISFPGKLDENCSKDVVYKIENYMDKQSSIYNEIFKSMHLWDCDNLIINTYMERQLISSKMLKERQKIGLMISEDETVIVTINDEDHIRIQCTSAGLSLKETFDEANKIEEFLEEKVDLAFDERLGYLTTSPANLGTGMKASIMMHLPALTLNKEINSLFKGLTQVGMNIKSVFKEADANFGNIYIISNQVSLGISEEEIINNLEAVACEVMLQEKNCRNQLMKNYEYEMKDKIFRALGTAQNSIMIDLRESIELMSYIRLGVELDILDKISISNLNRLMIEVQPYNLRLKNNKALSEKEISIERSLLIKQYLKNIEN